MYFRKWLHGHKEIFRDSDLRFLLKDVLHYESMALLEIDDILLDSSQLKRLDEITALYLEGMPLAYILGKEEFFGHSFDVNPRVLIPRQETELIVEEAVKLILDQDIYSVLDLCCGSGNIAISIQKAVEKSLSVVASDISFGALQGAQKNIKNSSSSVHLVTSDLLTSFSSESFDLIVANPPYVENACIRGMLMYEPYRALAGGADGLSYIRRIVNEAYHYLSAQGFLIMEFGYNQKNAVGKLITRSGCYQVLHWIKDYSGQWRGVVLTKSRVNSA